jgi:hypothetical protein
MSSKTDNALVTQNTSKQTDTKSQNTAGESEEQGQTQSLPNGMTPENAKAISIMRTEDSDAAVKYMFNPTGKRQLSYAEMRSRFG